MAESVKIPIQEDPALLLQRHFLPLFENLDLPLQSILIDKVESFSEGRVYLFKVVEQDNFIVLDPKDLKILAAVIGDNKDGIYSQLIAEYILRRICYAISEISKLFNTNYSVRFAGESRSKVVAELSEFWDIQFNTSEGPIVITIAPSPLTAELLERLAHG